MKMACSDALWNTVLPDVHVLSCLQIFVKNQGVRREGGIVECPINMPLYRLNILVLV